MQRRSLCVLLVALIGAADGLLLGGALAPPVAARSAASGARRLITTGAISMAAAEEKEISDGETVLRWVGVQGTVDLSILALPYLVERGAPSRAPAGGAPSRAPAVPSADVVRQSSPSRCSRGASHECGCVVALR